MLPLMLAGLGLGLGGAALGIQQNAMLQRQQDAANRKWVKYQKEQRGVQRMREEFNRARAEKSRLDALEKLDSVSQKDAQQLEAERLYEDLVGNIPPPQAAGSQTPYADRLLTGMDQGGKEVTDDFTRTIADGVAKARGQIQGLASMGSYGNSQFGLDRRNQNILRQAQDRIDQMNNFRRGDLGAYGIAQRVEPKQYPDQTVMGQLGTSLASIVPSATMQMGMQGMGFPGMSNFWSQWGLPNGGM